MSQKSYYQEYAKLAIKQYDELDSDSRLMLVNAVGDKDIERVLDVGCGAGQEMISFIEEKNAYCVGIDIGEEVGKTGNKIAKNYDCEEQLDFSRSTGEEIPFADESFDVVLCRVALPYMHNKKTIAEIGRVLKSGGVFLLKTHSPMFFIELLKRRAKTLSPRQVAYPLICIFSGVFHSLTGKQLQDGIWDGKQIFQTKGFLDREFAKNNMTIEGTLPDNNLQTPSFLVKKH